MDPLIRTAARGRVVEQSRLNGFEETASNRCNSYRMVIVEHPGSMIGG